MSRTGIAVVLDMLAEFGVRHVFGNPGTTELPLSDALVGDERFRYILGLQEVPVMAMADGYAMASGSLGVVNVHIACGLGNAMGMLYNAYREGTPMLVTAGQQDRRLKFEEPILGADLAAVARPWTKWSAEVERVEDLPAALRRGVQAALTPPTGPVFLAIPLDVQLATSEQLDLAPIRLPDRRVRPPAEAIRRAAALLLDAENPAILAGSRVAEADGVDELVAVAERLGAPVYCESGTTHGRLPFPCDHPLSGPGLPLWSPEVRERLNEFDVVLVVGMDLLRQYLYHEPSRSVPEHVRLVHIDEDPWQLGKNYQVEVGVIGDSKTSLAELAELLSETATREQTHRASRRAAHWSEQHAAARDVLRQRIAEQCDTRPMTPLAMMGALADAITPDTAVVEEAVTTTNTTLERLGAIGEPSGYFGHRGWALGWGLGVAVGVKLAWPNRPVLAILGDGAAMYGIQGLWSAAHHRIPVTFVIANNAQYEILKVGARGLQLPRAGENRFLGMDLVDPEIDFVALAGSLGVEACRVAEPGELTSRVAESLRSERPLLINVPIQRQLPDRLQYG